jgi:hypothetical protein
MGIGGLEQLEQLAALLEHKATAPERAARAAAPKLLAVAQQQWAEGRAPDGTEWPPTRDGRVPLTDLTSQATARADGAAVVLELPDQLKHHQEGSDRLPQRKVVPAPGDDPPEAWRAVLEGELAAEMEKGL